MPLLELALELALLLLFAILSVINFETPGLADTAADSFLLAAVVDKNVGADAMAGRRTRRGFWLFVVGGAGVGVDGRLVVA